MIKPLGTATRSGNFVKKFWLPARPRHVKNPRQHNILKRNIAAVRLGLTSRGSKLFDKGKNRTHPDVFDVAFNKFGYLKRQPLLCDGSRNCLAVRRQDLVVVFTRRRRVSDLNVLPLTLLYPAGEAGKVGRGV